MLTAADEVKGQGLSAAALDPLGAGLCLVIAGLVFAGPMWRAKLTTLPELFERRYSKHLRIAAAALAIPPYLGWIAAQYVALAGMLNLFFGLPIPMGILLVAFVGVVHTVLGGMWSVTLTDAFQMGFLVVGLVLTAGAVFSQAAGGQLVDGVSHVWATSPPGHRVMIPTETLAQLTTWLGILCAGSLGNIPSQDVMQRIFSARSESVARGACIAAGLLYLLVGVIPVGLGLAGNVMLDGEQGSTP